MAIEKWDVYLAHSSINFSVRHMMTSNVGGRFGKWTGTIEMDEQAPGRSRVEARIDAGSIDTRDTARDDHLRSSDFLEAGKHPEIVFRSIGVRPAGQRHFRIDGELTIRATTRVVVLDVEYAGRMKDPWGGERAGFRATTSIDRKEFGLKWNRLLEAGGVLVGYDVKIDIAVEVVKRKTPQGGPT
jgi:polyisoprenoid-binding protein YceI